MEKNVKFEFYGEKLFDFRKSKGLSQEELAEKIGVSRQTIYAWETGKSVPDTENLAKLCQVLEIETKDLVEGLSANFIPHKNRKKWKKKIFILILIIIIIHIIFSLNRFLLLNKVKNKIDNIGKYNNYYYEIFETSSKHLKKYDDTIIKKVYYKDGIVKETYEIYNFLDEKQENVLKEQGIEWFNNNTGEHYYFSEINKTVTKLDNSKVINDTELKIISNNTMIGQNKFANLLVGFVFPYINVGKENDLFYIKYNTNTLGYKTNHTEYINLETGFPHSKQIVDEDDVCKDTLYTIKLNEVTDEDVKIPDLTLYTLINKEEK